MQTDGLTVRMSVASILLHVMKSPQSSTVVIRYRGGGLRRISETHCSYDCLQYPFLFPYGSDGCISLSWKCDGEKDCPGGEDEANCDYKLGLFERKYPEFIIKKDPVEIYMFITLETYKPIKKYCNLYDTNEGIKSFIPNFGTYLLKAVRIQLIGGSLEISGRVEITRQGVKGTVCDDEFDNNDAKVICRMMGYSFGEVIPNIFRQGQGDIWLDDLSCTGSEYDLEVCPNLNWGVHNCKHKEDVAIKCFKAVNTIASITPTFSTDRNAIRIELVGGSLEISGRIEITRRGEKGSVCDNGFDKNEAKVICRMMGHSSGEVIPNIFGQGKGTIWLDNLNCTGSEYDIEVCPNLSWGKHNCEHDEDVALKCFKEANTSLSTSTISSTDQNSIRIQLIGGKLEISGRIEITRKGVKGTVCDDHFDNNDAKVICRMMGYSSGKVISNIYGQGQGVIWLDDLNCTGSEVELEICSNLSWGTHNCGHSEDVAIKCIKVNATTGMTPTFSTDQNAVRIQLVDGPSEISGRIEITRRGTIGSICDDEFDDNDAKVICRMMGYSIPPTSSTDQNVVRIQLIGGSSEINGRIEITRKGVKGTVCDDQFDNNDAKVICRMMGYSSGEVIPNIFGQGQGVIWLDDLNCTGSEVELEICSNLSWGKHNCGHNEDVAIKCFNVVNTLGGITPTSSADENAIRIQLVGGSSESSGRIEITRGGTKGSVCDDEFDDNDAKVICRMIGHSTGEEIPNIFGDGEGVIWLDDLNCTGSEYGVEICPNLSWGKHNCGHSEDVAIKCFKNANTTLLSTTSIPPTSTTDQNCKSAAFQINSFLPSDFVSLTFSVTSFSLQMSESSLLVVHQKSVEELKSLPPESSSLMAHQKSVVELKSLVGEQ
ncbi:unnamed protein product [Acanthosepion pharaonis]|uniref:SRCR domain-containing protein n=1 Tax=Acanthosepion pharaonis TaxID=158019 RepID=A0A812DE43_ACAPH|nr:unnamed protein product [Sepia pharaonis]